MKNTKEEWDQVDPYNPKDDKWWVKIEHLARYIFAGDYLAQFKLQVIADIATGVGYGIPELRKASDSILAVDSSPEILAQASAIYGGTDVTFARQDLEQDTMVSALGASSVDAIVSFETLEHLVNPSVAMAQFSQLIRPGGFLICSVPDANAEPRWPIRMGGAGLPANKCHKQLFNFKSLSRLLNEHDFQINYRVGQSWTNMFYRREDELIKNEIFQRKIGDRGELNTPEMIRDFAYLFAYPTAEDVDGSYSIMVVAQKADR